MMAFCGLNCLECTAYKGTVNSNLQLLEETAAKWSDKDHSFQLQDMFCLGCTQPDDRLVFTFCRQCPVRACALRKGIVNCVACQEYGECERMAEFMEKSGKPTLTAKMNLFRKRVAAS